MCKTRRRISREDGLEVKQKLPLMAAFAEKLNLSANYFGDLVKKETGKSTMDYIHLKLIDIAKERIFNAEKSISEIAYELGYADLSNFSRAFRKWTGKSASEFREDGPDPAPDLGP